MKLITTTWLLLAIASTASASRYLNPILPGFHPDPSCIYVEELDQTFFCATSTFSIFPGIPIYASKDLTNWKLASHVLNRRSQLPSFASTPTGQDGIFAPTLRYRNGTFHLTTTFVSIASYSDFTMDNLLFTTTDPYTSASWSAPLHIPFLGYDPSLFWDTDGVAHFTGAQATSTGTAIALAPISLANGTFLAPPTYPYNGTGIGTPEGPHLFHRDGYYYLLVAEGGSERLHRGALARARSVTGPYESYPHNPLVHAASNASLVQSVGHADLFQDAAGQAWGVALAMRCGPAFASAPMGRETVLFPVAWGADGWPRMQAAAQGVMEGPFALPGAGGGGAVDLPGEGAWTGEPDVLDFAPGTGLPPHFVHVRFPVGGAYVVSPPGWEGRLQLGLSERNLSATGGGNWTEGTTFVGRRQTDTLFTYSVDMEFEPVRSGEESGVTVYLDEKRHLDLGMVRLDDGQAYLRLRAFSSNENATVPEDVTTPIPTGDGKIRLEVRAANTTHYIFSAGSAPAKDGEDSKLGVVGYAAASLVTGGYTGTLVGTYATSNGLPGNQTTKAYVSRWRYQGQGQEVAQGVIV